MDVSFTVELLEGVGRIGEVAGGVAAGIVRHEEGY